MLKQEFQRDRKTGVLISYYVDRGPAAPVPGHGRTVQPCSSMSASPRGNVRSSGVRITGTT